MKLLNIKAALVIGLLFFGMSQSAVAQTETEPQPMVLTDHVITFYSVQMEFSSVVVEPTDSELDTSAPVITLSEDELTFTIDFTDCETGEYLITGTRDGMELPYIVDHIK